MMMFENIVPIKIENNDAKRDTLSSTIHPTRLQHTRDRRQHAYVMEQTACDEGAFFGGYTSTTPQVRSLCHDLCTRGKRC